MRSGGARVELRQEWFVQQVLAHTSMTIRQRAMVGADYLRSRIVRNISKSVHENIGGVDMVVRSAPGEYPRADTTTLMKSIFTDMKSYGPMVWEGYVGTPVYYSISLELFMDRSFLRRTFLEEFETLKAVVTGRR